MAKDIVDRVTMFNAISAVAKPIQLWRITSCIIITINNNTIKLTQYEIEALYLGPDKFVKQI